jgi:ribosome silencing factor RsfS/YbeB/iojap
VDALDDMKALDVKVLDVRGLTDIADYMVIASGTSDRHVRSVAQRVVEKIKEAGSGPHGVEGEQDGDWVLIDLERNDRSRDVAAGARVLRSGESCGTCRFPSARRAADAIAMKCRLIAAGTRLPEWINMGFEEYRRRLRTPLVLELQEVAVASRRAGEDPKRAVHREGEDMLALIGRDDYVVALEIGAQNR